MGKTNPGLMEWIRPLIVSVAVYILGVILYNLFIIGNLQGIPGEFGSVEVDSGYKITCHFKIKNKGLISIKSGKIQLNIPKAANISEIDIPSQYNYLYKIIDGGKGYNYVVFLIEGLKGRKIIEGSISFSQNKKWEKDYVNPLSFSK